MYSVYPKAIFIKARGQKCYEICQNSDIIIRYTHLTAIDFFSGITNKYFLQDQEKINAVVYKR